MRLLDTYTGRFVEKDPRKDTFKYAILSYTWDCGGEQTYEQLKKIQGEYASENLLWGGMYSNHPVISAIWGNPKLSLKILNACVIARKDGYRYIWIDSCCIDKTSSSELSEAINSMYAWYAGADVCYAYLADVLPDENPQEGGSRFRTSRWFKRGWTLQELIAPAHLRFLNKDWTPLGTKEELAGLVNAVTGISIDVLLKPDSLHDFSVAQRLSWAAGRETTRVEDRAYSLLGIFDINMPTLYGEGERAFQRLQEEILRRIPDQSLFAWGFVNTGDSPRNVDPRTSPLQLNYESPHHFTLRPITLAAWDSSSISLLSPSPDTFVGCGSIEAAPISQLLYHYPDLPIPDYGFTPFGIRTQIPLIPLHDFLPDCSWEYSGDPSKYYLAILGCEHADHPGHLFARVCYASPSPSGVQTLTQGCLAIDNLGNRLVPELVLLSLDVLARSSALAMVATVLLSRRDQPKALQERNAPHLPHKTIHLLLKKTGTPRPHGLNLLPAVNSPESSAAPAQTKTLRRPDEDHPTTHWLTVSRPSPTSQPAVGARDTFTIEYRHTLEDDGRRLIVEAHITGTLEGRPIIPVTKTWTDTSDSRNGWGPVNADRKLFILHDGKARRLLVGLGLEYLARNHYLIDVNVR